LDGGDTAASTGGGRARVQGSVDTALEQTHPNGVTVEVTEVAAEGNAVYVGLEAVNLHRYEVMLRRNPVELYLVVDGERRIQSEEPAGLENMQLRVPPGGEMTARLAFIGRIPSPDSTLELRMNWDDTAEVDPDNPETFFPSFRFELPNPGAASS
jgi:hypothetical protein